MIKTIQNTIILKSLMLLLGLLYFPTLKAQYLHVDRIGLKCGIALNGNILMDQKPDSVVLLSEEYGKLKIKYEDISSILYKPDPNDPFFRKGGHQYFSAGLGYGAEYANYGARFQIRVGRKFGFAHFIGLGIIDKERPKKRIFDGHSYLYSEDMGSYKTMNISTGIKFYPYTYFYFGGGIHYRMNDNIDDLEYFFMIGTDWPWTKHILLNASMGYFSDKAHKSPTGALMINLGFSYKITTNPIK